MTGYRILKTENLPESLRDKPRWMLCMVFSAGLIIMTLSAISAGIFIGYTYCYVEYRTGFRTVNATQTKDLQIINLPSPEPEEVHKRTINGALTSSVLVQKILKVVHAILDDEQSLLGADEKRHFEEI